MERTVQVATGESVAFEYELAGLGSRFLAVFIDNVIQVTVVIAAFALLLWLVPSKGTPTHADASDPFFKFGYAVAVGVLIFAGFLLFFGYFIAFEWLWNGQTPGKRLLGIRVVRDGGFPLDFTSAAVRNLVRVIEAALGYYAVSAAVMLLSPRNRRLGDLAAGTLVVRDERYHRPRTLGDGERDDPVLRDLTAGDRDLILRFAERRASLTRDARTALAAQIAAAMRPKLGASYEHLGDEDLLAFLAERLPGSTA